MKNVNDFIFEINTFILDDLKSAWDKDDLYNEGEDSTIHDLFCFLSHFISERLNRSEAIKKDLFFNYIEELMSSEDELIENAVTTCFLETLINMSGFNFKDKNFIPYLGEKSRVYCIAWDNFNGGSKVKDYLSRNDN